MPRLSKNTQRLLQGYRETETQKKYLENIKKGKIPLKIAKASGKFKKIAWDMYKKVDAPDTESIWTLSDIDGEQWLVLYTDHEGQIVRGLQASILESTLKKTASKKAISVRVGDVVEVTASEDSINRKYDGIRGEVIAAYPERSQLSFQDGYTMWFENKDLSKIREAHVLDLGDTVKLKKSNRVVGKVEKINGDAITFRSKTGKTFSAKIENLEKITKSGNTVVLWTDDPKSALKYLTQGQTPPPSPVPEGVPPTGEQEAMPPAIKAQPSEEEMEKGTAIPAHKAVEPSVKQMAERQVFNKVYGRSLNIGDQVLNKVTNERGIIVDLDIDRKLGKYYTINYGGQNASREYETNLKKLSPSGGGIRTEQPPTTVPGFKMSSAFKEYGIIKEAQGAESLEQLRGGGGPGSVSNVEPMTWEVKNEGSEAEKAQQNVTDEALNEAMSDERMELGKDNKINIEIDPDTKKITIDLGEEEAEELLEKEIEPTQPPGSPVTPTPLQRGSQPGTEFGQEDIGVEF